jgi:hypothetical protein
MQKVMIGYKDAGEREWLFRTIQFELKDVDPVLLIVSASRVYLDFSLTLTEFFKPKVLIQLTDLAQLYLTLSLISTLTHTNKGRGLLSLLLPDFNPEHLVQFLKNDFTMEIHLQILSILSKDIATKPHRPENVGIYT